MKKIAIIGLGYVGLPLAVEFGKIRQTIGFDINAQRVTELEGGFDRTNECSDADLARARNLKFSSDLRHLRDASIYIVTVPTPIDNAKRPNLTPLKSASKMVGSVLAPAILLSMNLPSILVLLKKSASRYLKPRVGSPSIKTFPADTAQKGLIRATKSTRSRKLRKLPAVAIRKLLRK